ncbi:MAG: DsbA family protein [Candidatus Binataceae bacterium]
MMSSDTFSPLASSAPLIVYIDYKSPYAYLAIEPTQALEDELGVEADWRPFTLDIPSYLGSARLNQEGKVVESERTPGQWTKVKYAYHDVRRYGSLRGIIVRGTVKIWDSSLAGIGMLWAKQQDQAVLRSYSGIVYERFWKRELNLEDAGAIEHVLEEAGARTAGFQDYAAGEGRVLHDSIQRKAFDAGIFGVPTYVIDGELFFGREHLPRIRWMLTGRSGAPPDVAYGNLAAEPATAGKIIEGQLPVVIDFKSPQAYIAIGPTFALADELGITIDWQPLVVAPSKTPSAPSGQDRGARHRRFRADYLERDIARYAADRGLAMAGPLNRNKDSTLAAIGLLWARRQGPSVAGSYVARVFERYWKEDLDIEDERTIRTLFTEIGAPVSGFEAFVKEEGRAELARVESELRGIGVFEVPTYLLDGDTFLGRQHLPLLRSRLIEAAHKVSAGILQG